MTLSSDRDPIQSLSEADKIAHISTFPLDGRLESTEQIRRFELLRLAFFVLKLRRLEHHVADRQTGEAATVEPNSEQEFRRNLLRHVIFQQVLTLTRLDAREQALQIIAACRK